MAFSTGSFSGGDGFDVVMTKLHDFAVAQGWTSHINSFPYLHVSKSGVFVNLYFNEIPTVDNRGNGGTATDPDYTIYGHLSTAFTSNGTPSIQFLNQTDSLVNGSDLNNTAFMKSNDWVGPYSTYWLFSGAGGDPDYVHMVVQKANGRFCMLSFGTLDKKGAVYTGGGFLHGMYFHWWFTNGSSPGFFSSQQGSDALSVNHTWIGDSANILGNSGGNYNIWIGSTQDATYPMIAQDGTNSGKPYEGLVPLMGRGGQSLVASLGLNLEDFTETQMLWLGMIFYLGPNPVNGISPLFEIPIIKAVSANSRGYYLGALPGMQFCSMINRLEAEDLSFGSDDWIVFPFKRALPWRPEPFAVRTITSGPYGYACKKNT